MKQTNEWMNESADKDILFSRTVKAGKRVYYFDVKRDRRDALYLSITESKRVKEGKPEERPVFEKHKIFLYREDMEKFLAAISAATGYAIQNSPMPEYEPSFPHGDDWGGKSEDYFAETERCESGRYGGNGDSHDATNISGGKIKIDLDF